MNIRFHYLYRDGGNNKQHGEVIFVNPDDLSIPEIEQRLRAKFDERDAFIADQINIPPVFHWLPIEDKGAGYEKNDEDHNWHEFGYVEKTTEDATETRTVKQFVEQVEAVEKWTTE